MLFIYFHIMSSVRVHPRRSRDLIDAYEDSATTIDDAIGQLSPLISEAMTLLERPIRPQQDPMANFFDTVVALRKDSDDLAWRLELIETGDSRSMGEHTVLDLDSFNSWVDDGDVSLIDALIAAGLTEAQAQEAKKAVGRGAGLEEAVRDQLTDEQVAALELAELNERIDNWSGTDNDPIFDQWLRERREAIETLLASDDPVAPEAIVQLLLALTPFQAAQAEADNPGTIDIALLDAIVTNHDINAFPDDPINPVVENARDIRDVLVANLAGDIDGRPDPAIAAVAQRNGISYADAELVLEVVEIDRLNDESQSIPHPQSVRSARDRRDTQILDFVDGDVVLAASIGRFMSQGHSFAEASQLALNQLTEQAIREHEANQPPIEPEDDRGFFGDVYANIFGGESVVGAVITKDYFAVGQAVVEHGPGIASTVVNAADEISALDPRTPQGRELLLTDPGQFLGNWENFGGGALDWTKDTGKLVGALAIAGNPLLNEAFENQNGRNIQQEVAEALTTAARMAADDPDAFAAMAVNWEMLEDDPIRWAGEAAPEVIIEVVTAGGASGFTAGRRAGRTAANAADTASDAAAAAQRADAPSTQRVTAPARAGAITPPLPDNLRQIGDIDLDSIDIPPPPNANSVAVDILAPPTVNSIPVDIPPPPSAPLDAAAMPPISDNFLAQSNEPIEMIGDIKFDEDGYAVSVDRESLFSATDTQNDPLLEDANVQEQMAEAWLDSVDLYTHKENGGWIVVNADGTHGVQRWPAGEPARIKPPEMPDNAVGSFHTHPDFRNPSRPSRADINYIKANPASAPHYVVSHDGTFVINADGSYVKLG